MEQSESGNHFKEAGSLYKQGRYQEALPMLEELNRTHPDTQRILYPMALCLAKLQRHDEAMQLTSRLILEFEYEPARKLQAELQESYGSGGLTDLADLDLGPSGGSSFGSPAGSSVGPPVIHMESFTSKYFSLILVAIFLVVLAVFVVLQNRIGFQLSEWSEAARQQPDSPLPFPIVSLLYNIFSGLAIGFFGGCVGAYCGLAVVQALPEDGFNDNLKDIALYVFYGTLLYLIPILGWIAILVIIYKHYDLRFGSLIVTVFIFVLINTVVSMGLAFFIELIAVRI